MSFILDTLGKIGFEWQMGLFNLINFLILFFILKKYLFGPVLNKVKDRQKLVEQSVENIQKAKTELQMAEKKAQDIIDVAKGEASKIVEKSYLEAEELGVRMKDKAKAEIELLITQAKKNIDIDRDQMQEELKQHTAMLVSAAVERILDEKMDSEKDTEYIEKVIKSFA